MTANTLTPFVSEHVLTETTAGGMGLITLNRPRALNALSLDMVRAITAALRAWVQDDAVKAVAIRGMGKQGEGHGPFGAFCAGGDIRAFHQAALAGDDAWLAAFFTEEYTLNHLIHTYPKPYIAFMDGIVMGGGMGLSQGASLRVVTERTVMAMPETRIGLFPDVGGGYFLSRTPGRLGEYLALSGHVLKGDAAVAATLADGCVPAATLPDVWQHLADTHWPDGQAALRWVAAGFQPPAQDRLPEQGEIDHYFAAASVPAIVAGLEASNHAWAQDAAAQLRTRSPLMLHVTLEQIRRARQMTLAEDLRMERDLVHHCFHLRAGQESETVEGIRALAVDKDHSPRWRPARIEDITPDMVAPFFTSPWPAAQHPLAGLA